MQTAAVIDIGSNTIKSLCTRLTSEGSIKVLYQKSHDARLGGEHKAGQPWLTDNKRAGALSAVEDLMEAVNEFSPDKIALVGTSAIREAANQQQFAEELQHRTGHQLRILSEQEEANYIGAGIAQDPDIPDQDNFTAFDLGGGSLERIVYKNGEVLEEASYPLGAVRLTRSLCPQNGTQPLTSAEIESIQAKVLSTLPTVEPTHTLIGSGGAFSISRAILLSRIPENKGLDAYQLLKQTTYQQLSLNTIQELAEEIQALSLSERTQIPFLPPGRADILPTALHIILAIAKKHQAQTWHHTLYNLRFGLAASLLRSKLHEV